MKILLTGGAGFIGSAVVRLAVSRGHHVVNIDALTYAACLENVASVAANPLYVFEKADIRDRAALDRIFAAHEPDVVMHLAAESHVDRSIDAPGDFIETNINGTFNMLEAARSYWMRAGKPQHFRFHHISTDEVFGSLPADPSLRFTESTPYDPRSPYSASKAGSDHLVRAWHETYGLPVVLTNCSNNYGPYHFPEKLIPVIILNALADKPLPIYGNGSNIRDWLYVEDHADALLLVVEKGKIGSSYAIGGENERTNLELVKMLCTILDQKRPKASGSYADQITFVTDRPGHDARYAIDPARICAELGWRPSVTVEEGLEKTVQWYLDNESWWRPLQARMGVGERLGTQSISQPVADKAGTRHLSRHQARSLQPGSEHVSAYVGPPKQWDFMGATQLRLLTALGLREHHKLLDVGCGSLRAGRLFIPYLNANSYCGLEPNAWLVNDAIAIELGSDLVTLKSPRFAYRADFDASEFGEQFDFILAQSIFSHAGPGMLKQALSRLAPRLAANGLILFTVLETARHPKAAVEIEGWVYPQNMAYRTETLHDLSAGAGLVLQRLPWYHPRQTWFALAKAKADLIPEEQLRHLTGAVLRDPEFAASQAITT